MRYIVPVKVSRYLLLICLLTQWTSFLFSQEDVLKYVNPFIGTTKTRTFSRWGSEGGTYPGAVAPFGYIQLSPETRTIPSAGYDYNDTLFLFFSCLNHKSGYPEGSSGNIHIMPVSDTSGFQPGKYCRPFSHSQEKSEPGFYSVILNDDGTSVEATASVRAGMFRITFPAGVKPSIFIGNIGKLTVRSDTVVEGQLFNTKIIFNRKPEHVRKTGDGNILTFFPSSGNNNILLLKISASTVSQVSTQKNLDAEAPGWSFESFRKSNRDRWAKELKVIEVEDTSTINKTVFYTALYHSLLLPYVISDVEGRYMGAGGKIFRTKGAYQYGSFSPWDTFRTLHPLLCILEPERQRDMILSLLSTYEQTGRLPKGPMTGNHVIPIIVDSWMKGVRGFDSTLAFNAMKSMTDESNSGSDFIAYSKAGYVPASYSESVTRTVEYAYNDWALAVFTGEVMNNSTEYKRLIQRSLNYRNLIDPATLFLVPRDGSDFISESACFGYKEGDKWSYSLFVPHNPVDLINLSGGQKDFAERLDFALENGKIPFDNEPVLHVPYLFNYSGAPYQTQKWVRKIMSSHYTAFPSGLPGNDDLGSMSSWFVFSAMGFFPVCPGRPVYDIGSPLFKKVTIHFHNGKKLVIRSENNGSENVYVKSFSLNGTDQGKPWILHPDLARGGEIVFSMTDKPASAMLAFSRDEIPSLTKNPASFRIRDFNCTKTAAEPGEKCMVGFSYLNSGSFGAKTFRLYIDGKEYSAKSVLADSGVVKYDSIECRFFPVGKRSYTIDDLEEKNIEIVKNEMAPAASPEITDLEITPLLRVNNNSEFSYSVRNAGGFRDSMKTLVFLDDSLISSIIVDLRPGELKKITHTVRIAEAGIHLMRAGSESVRVKTYLSNTDSKIIDIKFPNDRSGKKVDDRSGLQNDAIIIRDVEAPPKNGTGLKTDAGCYAEFENSPSASISGNNLTVMAWIFPSVKNSGLSDIITQGDYNVIQTSGNRSISFFAGGWGRGSCTVMLPSGWNNKWHHIAGVCEGRILRIYIDGKEEGMVDTGENSILATTAKWNLGRNEEFPDSRFFNGSIDCFKLFSEPLTPGEIEKEMKIDSPLTKIK